MKISIITSAYNCETTLGRTIESVLSQSFQDFEYIIVNHGSTDGTGDVIAQYMAKDKRISTISMAENTGFIGKAMNKGIQQAKGDYLCFIDGDDVYQPHYLQTLYDDVTENDYDIAICGSSRVDETGKEFLIDTIAQPCALVSSEEYFSLPPIINQTPTRYFTVWWNKIIKKSYIQELNLYFPEDTLVHGDAIFLLKLYRSFPKMYCGERVGIAWTQQSGSTSFGTYKPAYFEEMMVVVDLYLKFYEEIQAKQEDVQKLADKLLTTLVTTRRLEHIKGSQEEKEGEKARWESHPLYQTLLTMKGGNTL